ncbi:MAG: hypothetical protein JO371_07975 [Paraburkholderia sp.]|nr:hypothetical protein [Paraburkholderia sp.]
MRLTLLNDMFYAFSQADDIKADIKNGWCAGVTAKVSFWVGSFSAELGYGSTEEWLTKYAYVKAKQSLQEINKDTHVVGSLQTMLSRITDKRDVTSEIHLPKFDGRTCKVALSVAAWLPIISPGINYALMLGDMGFGTHYSKWNANHIGLIVRGGRRLMLFDPNYGLGVFAIGDDAPLTLGDITAAVGMLAWNHSLTAYYGSKCMAIGTMDESGLNERVELDLIERVDDLVRASKNFAV